MITKKLIRWLIVLGLVFFLVLQTWQFFISLPFWKISSVEVQGNLYWPEDSILSQLKLPFGESIFRVDLKELRIKVEGLPQVIQAELHRRLPSTIVFNIKERAPWAKTTLAGGDIILGEDGKVLNLTGIDVLETNKLLYLQGITSLQDLEPFAIKFRSTLAELRKVFPENRIDVTYLPPFDIQCLIDRTLLLKWGTEEKLEEKMTILQAILPVIQNKWNNVAYIDIRSPKNLAIRYKR